MYEFLNSIGLWGVGVIFVTLVLSIIYLIRFMFDNASRKILANRLGLTYGKKYAEVDTNQYRLLFSNIGLALSLLFIFVALEFPNFNNSDLTKIGVLNVEDEPTLQIPPTVHELPPPPKVKVIEIIEIEEDDSKEEDAIDFKPFEIEDDIDDLPPPPVEVIKEEVTDEPFIIVEDPAAPIGGYPAFYKYVGKHIKYPKVAQRLGIEGRVIVQFIVERDGSITDVKILQGIGGGCDEEALRVLSKAPTWKPGKQRGKPVRQRMVLPIVFKLR